MSSIVDSLTQAVGVAVIRGVATTDSLWLSPLRTLSTNSDRQHSAGVRGFVENPAALVQPWVAKDIASPNVSDGDPSAAPLLGAISGVFTPWVKDLVRWASTRHLEELARPLDAVIRDAAASRDHDVDLLGDSVA